MVAESEVLEVLKLARVDIPKDGLRNNVPLGEQGVDSLEMAVVLFELEKKFEVRIPTATAGRLRTVDDILHFLNAGPVGSATIQ